MAKNTTTETLDPSSDVPFEWRWLNRDDQALSITWTGIDTTTTYSGHGISVRLTNPKVANPVNLDLIDGTDLSTTAASPAVTTTSSDIAADDLPAPGHYDAEWLIHEGDTDAAGAWVLKRGTVVIEHSVGEN